MLKFVKLYLHLRNELILFTNKFLNIWLSNKRKNDKCFLWFFHWYRCQFYVWNWNWGCNVLYLRLKPNQYILLNNKNISKSTSGLSYSDPEDKSLSNLEIEPLLPPQEDEESRKKVSPPNIPVEGEVRVLMRPKKGKTEENTSASCTIRNKGRKFEIPDA